MMTDRDYMLRAIELAKKGEGYTNPNPMVGAVIVKDNQIIGEGYHERCGQLHAERNAFKNLTQDAAGATLYVTLEPCCHYGKTPPCTEAIIENRISKVVIGSRDPNPKVSGKGAKLLREAGIEVVEDFMKEECDRLNPVFFHYITNRTPYVIYKYAMTADGKIATKTGASRWITGEQARMQVHMMRHKYMAILAGIGTVLADDPMLNTRIEGLKSPIRVICDSHLKIPMESRIVKTARDYETIVVCANASHEKIQALENAGINVLIMPGEDGRVDMLRLMHELGRTGVDSLLVEGGGTINDALMRERIGNRVELFIGSKIFGGKDAKSPVEGIGIENVEEGVKLEMNDFKPIGNDFWISYDIRW